MMRVVAKHLPYDDGHLAEVLDTMRLCGAPTIRVVRFDGDLLALEGSHRLAAAHQLGLEPRLVVLETGESALDAWFRCIARPRLPSYEFDRVWLLDINGVS